MLSTEVRRRLARAHQPAVASTFIHDREPRPEWVEALRDVSPLTNAHGSLMLVWEPGDPWTPGQRWMLYEMLAPEQANYETVLALRGPNPRATGHMCTSRPVPGQFACLCRVKLEGWRQEDGSPSEISLTQWKLYQQTGKVGRPFWVIQGSKGGHKAFLTSEEERFLRMADKPTTLPAIGDLPYAEFDQRVVQHIVRHNRLLRMGLDLRAYRKRMGPDYALHQAQVERELRQQVVAWLDEQMQPEIELFQDAAKKGEMDGQATTEIDWEKVGEQGIASYIETGQLLHPSRVQ